MPSRSADTFAGPANPNTGTFLGPDATRDDGDGRKYILLDNGQKFYTLPQDASSRDSGGGFHKPANWNPKTGQWEPGGVDWQSVGIWLGAATIGGYAAAAYSPVAATVASTPVATSGVGIGETAATTGLTGSGFGSAVGGGTATAGVGGGTTAGTTWAGLSDGVAGTNGVVGGTSAANVGGGLVPGSTSGLGSLGWASLAANVGSQAVGAYLQSKAAGKATDAEAKANADALAFAKDVYQTQRSDSAPYLQLGQNSARTLSDIIAQLTPKGNYKSSAYDANTPQGPNQAPIPAAPGVNVGDPRLGTGQPVTMVAPNGEEKAVPADQVQHWISKGAAIKPAGGSPAMSAGMPQSARPPSIGDYLQRGTV